MRLCRTATGVDQLMVSRHAVRPSACLSARPLLPKKNRTAQASPPSAQASGRFPSARTPRGRWRCLQRTCASNPATGSCQCRGQEDLGEVGRVVVVVVVEKKARRNQWLQQKRITSNRRCDGVGSKCLPRPQLKRT